MSNTSLVCSECGAKNPDDYRFCFSCGRPLPDRAEAPPDQAGTPIRAGVICPKCQAANPEEYLYCKQCGTRLRRRPEPKKALVVPLVIGVIGGIVGGAYSYGRGALPIRVAFAAVGDAGVWWAVAAFITWLVRPSRRRAAALGSAVLMTTIVFGGYLLLQYVTGQYLGYVQLPDGAGAGASAAVVVQVTARPTQRLQRPPPTFVNPFGGSRATPTPVYDPDIPWLLAGFYVGERKCIRGTVHHVQTSGSAFFIHFAAANESFYGYSYKWYWEKGQLEGKCVLICGTVETNYGRPRILIDDPKKQVFECE